MNDCPVESRTPAAPPKSWYELLKATFKKWSEDSASRLAAAFSYYAIFSIGPLLIIAITLIGLIYGQKAANDQIRPQLASMVGEKAAGFVQDIVKNVAESATMSLMGIVSVVLILYAATNLFIALQESLNIIFGVRPKPGRGLREMVRDRAFSILMVAMVGVFVLASIIATTVLVAVLKKLGGPEFLIQAGNFAVSAVVFTGIFAMMFKYLPDIKIGWKETLIGAVFTAVLFTLARIGLAYYLGRSSTAGPFGAAGSLVIIMLFIYYSAQIFFLGAEFTQVWACRTGNTIIPSDNAMAVESGQEPKPEKGKGKKAGCGVKAGGAGKSEQRSKGEALPAMLAGMHGSSSGQWERTKDGKGWNWIGPEQAVPTLAGSQAESTVIQRPIGRLHPPMRFPRDNSPAKTAGVAALMVLPVAWFYLRRSRNA
jgi:membrane protein